MAHDYIKSGDLQIIIFIINKLFTKYFRVLSKLQECLKLQLSIFKLIKILDKRNDQGSRIIHTFAISSLLRFGLALFFLER